MDRRDVLRALALAGPLTITGRLYAAPQTSTRLLVVFLRGAYDAANVVIPVSSEFLNSAESNIVFKTATISPSVFRNVAAMRSTKSGDGLSDTK